MQYTQEPSNASRTAQPQLESLIGSAGSVALGQVVTVSAQLSSPKHFSNSLPYIPNPLSLTSAQSLQTFNTIKAQLFGPCRCQNNCTRWQILPMFLLGTL
jgi:hypothetical protein